MHLFKTVVFVVVVVVVYVLLVHVQVVASDQTEYDLIHSILKDYDSSIRPSQHHNYTLNVTFGLSLTQLIDINWIDHKLQWDPFNFNNIHSVHIPADRIWKPDILLVNNADSWAKTSSISTNAIVRHDGNVTWLSTVIFKSSCSINVRYFPFDEQQCDMIFASWTFDGVKLDIDVNSNEGDITNYIKNGEWHLVHLIAFKRVKKYSCCDEPYPEIYYRLVIRRRPLFYVFNMVFPCLLITLVAFLGFYLPPGSTEKVSIGITTLLSITVFLMLVAESMPPTSEQLPLLGIYYAVTIGIVSFSTALAVITLNIANKGYKGRKVPRLVKLIFFDYLSKIMCINLRSKARRKQHERMWKEDDLHAVSSSSSKQQPHQRPQPPPQIVIGTTHSAAVNCRNKQECSCEDEDAMSCIELIGDKSPSILLKPPPTSSSSSQHLKDDHYNNKRHRQHHHHHHKKHLHHHHQYQNQGHDLSAQVERVLSKQFGTLVDALVRTLAYEERRAREMRTFELVLDEWSDVAMISDHILCYFFCLLTLACCVLIFFHSPHVLAEW